MNKKMKVFSALCIIFVVFKHIGHDVIHEPLTYTPVWRIPAFVFISGYFYDLNYKRFTEYTCKYIKKLLMPLYGWSLFYGVLVSLLIANGLVNFGEKIDLKNFFVDTFIHTHQYEFNSAMWFLPVLFLVKIIYAMIRKIIETSFYYDIFITVVLIGLNFFSVYFSRLYFHDEQIRDCIMLPFIKMLFFLIFFHVGFFYKKYLEDKDRFRVSFVVTAFFINLCIATFFCGDTQDISKLKYFYFDSSWMNFYNKNVWVPFVTSITGIYIWLHISELISKKTNSNDIIIKIGNHTFSIMVHHIFCFWILNTCLNLGIKVLGWNISGFNNELYMNNVWYKLTDYWPMINFTYLFFGIIGSIYIDLIYRYLKSKITLFLRLFA